MRILVDTNIVLDVLLDRKPHADHSAAVLVAVEQGIVTGVLGATTFTTLHYLLTRALGVKTATRHVGTLLALCDVAPVGIEVLNSALSLGFADFEDAVLHEAGRTAGVDAVVTRDRAGFKRATLRVYSPRELLAIIGGQPTSSI